MILQSNKLPGISIFNAIGQFTIAEGEIITIIQNTTQITLNDLQFARYAQGKYEIRDLLGRPIFKENKTTIHPAISESASIPLSKTTWGDYNYHFSFISTSRIEILCQKTSDNTYQDFTEIFDGIKIPIYIEVYNQ